MDAAAQVIAVAQGRGENVDLVAEGIGLGRLVAAHETLARKHFENAQCRDLVEHGLAGDLG
jgi:hypothetical protein